MKHYNAFQIKLWIDDNLPQISWNILVLACATEFIDENISPRSIDKDTVFSELLVNKLSQEIILKYQKIMSMEQFELKELNTEF